MDGWIDRLTDGRTEIAGQFGHNIFRTFDTFRTQVDSDPSLRRFRPKTEDVSDAAFRPYPVIINNVSCKFSRDFAI